MSSVDRELRSFSFMMKYIKESMTAVPYMLTLTFADSINNVYTKNFFYSKEGKYFVGPFAFGTEEQLKNFHTDRWPSIIKNFKLKRLTGSELNTLRKQYFNYDNHEDFLLRRLFPEAASNSHLEFKQFITQ